ncbi:hypothetical protein [Cohaesibacter sp. ES.047]|uniref:hypothetical protein n=1 Tax=Cohaesibacter sp. ES.047 TaxID=1798205 RepID=UPI000BB7BEAA|nr:hypothetical protein [Cohaesibacter sp. ES.047]
MIKLTRSAPAGERTQSTQTGSHQECLTRAIMWAFEDLGSELRLIDVDHLIAYIHSEAHGNIRDLIASSAELFFREGTVIYSDSADMVVEWGDAPRIMLDLEFRNAGVVVKFEMLLAASVTDINLQELTIEQPADSVLDELDCLVDALKGARLKPVATEWSPKSTLN